MIIFIPFTCKTSVVLFEPKLSGHDGSVDTVVFGCFFMKKSIIFYDRSIINIT